MPAASNESDSDSLSIDELIAAYLSAVDAGDPPSMAEFIAKHGEHADELAAFFADSDYFGALIEPLQSAAGTANEATNEATRALASPSCSSDDLGPSVDANLRQFGDYELLEEIARGGMGVVYKARQISLNRIVALKMIQAGHLASQEEIKRFQAEAEAAANLDHEGLIPIFEVGEHAGQPFFSMGYVDGPSLADDLREGPLPPRAAAQLMKQVCLAVQYAHERGVVHRDLKPANILLERPRQATHHHLDDTKSGSSRDSIVPKPRIADFGLAKRLKSDSQLTQTGQIIGTPAYMSPEQAGGTTHAVGPASDIFSLGAVFYQLLTGRPPFQAETPLKMIAQIVDAIPPPPTSLNREVPRDLEAICMKCLSKYPAGRYASARELADDLDRYLEGENVRASGVNFVDRLAGTLQQSRHEEVFQGWGLPLIWFGAVILLAHVAIYVLEQTSLSVGVTYFVPRAVMFALVLFVIWRFRRHSWFPTNSAERIVWGVWIGYLLALGAVNAARLVQGHEQAESYAIFSVLAGFGFLIMGAHVWGGGYVLGLLFLLATPALALYSHAAPLIFGLLWAAALWAFGVRFWDRERRRQTAVPRRVT